ncbi:GAF domain-containing protein [Ktedonosporobacter rubrisoli]|uniref:GAF domain-containing protein n=1 Tax=Ktedonosporobacter rubrisoli TaxID=2509675 RepID=A0A4P6K432_KTERU|nr:GAF domain-containing protein [Ktedonosporobacter rubrisoli]QBD83048.1 GAF domain-containing protein [Ktedonosporobacter rubrisoli]
MDEPQTWRELLGKVTSNPYERQRIADAIGINAITLTRWVLHKSNPRQDNLRPLLETLPTYREQFIELISREYPDFLETSIVEDIPPEIPSAFYARVLHAHTTSPQLLRAATIRILILQQILGHLDPFEAGLAVIIAQCVPPSQGKIRSLRITQGRGTPPWERHIEYQTLFLGAESQAGQAILSGHRIVIQSKQQKLRAFPTHHVQMEESTVAYPILRADRVAGCLCLSSTQANYFTHIHLDLIRRYADLMVFAFEHDEFYSLCNIELGIMPAQSVQQQILAHFQRRVTEYVLHAMQSRTPLTRPKAEQIVWKELEGELLSLA